MAMTKSIYRVFAASVLCLLVASPAMAAVEEHKARFHLRHHMLHKTAAGLQAAKGHPVHIVFKNVSEALKKHHQGDDADDTDDGEDDNDDDSDDDENATAAEKQRAATAAEKQRAAEQAERQQKAVDKAKLQVELAQKELEEIKVQQRIYSHEAEELMNKETRNLDIQEKARAVANETQTPKLAGLLSDMWQDMRKYSAPFYIDYINNKTVYLHKEEKVLQKKYLAAKKHLERVEKQQDGEDSDDDTAAEQAATKKTEARSRLEKSAAKLTVPGAVVLLLVLPASRM